MMVIYEQETLRERSLAIFAMSRRTTRESILKLNGLVQQMPSEIKGHQLV